MVLAVHSADDGRGGHDDAHVEMVRHNARRRRHLAVVKAAVGQGGVADLKGPLGRLVLTTLAVAGEDSEAMNIFAVLVDVPARGDDAPIRQPNPRHLMTTTYPKKMKFIKSGSICPGLSGVMSIKAFRADECEMIPGRVIE